MGLSNLEHGTYEMFKEGKCRCDDCRAAQQERRRLVKQEYRRRRYAENPEIQREYTRRWQRKNREYSIAKAREWNLANRERYNANARAWRQRNPEKMAEQNRHVKALRRNAETKKVSAKDWRRLVDRYGGLCAYCGERKKLTMEHIIPVSRGGRHSIGNLLPVCMSCNSSKKNKFLVEWKKAS